jgi:hypothetical protein
MISVLSCLTLSSGIARRDTNDYSNQFKRVVFTPETFLPKCESPIDNRGAAARSATKNRAVGFGNCSSLKCQRSSRTRG